MKYTNNLTKQQANLKGWHTLLLCRKLQPQFNLDALQKNKSQIQHASYTSSGGLYKHWLFYPVDKR